MIREIHPYTVLSEKRTPATGPASHRHAPPFYGLFVPSANILDYQTLENQLKLRALSPAASKRLSDALGNAADFGSRKVQRSQYREEDRQAL